MREPPADFNAKREEYIRIASRIVHENNVPPQRVINVDETKVCLCPQAKYTYAVQGAKKVRLHGVGHEKEVVTATLAITESGDVLKAQMIWKGKTKRCHPQSECPESMYSTQTLNHWQDSEPYVGFINNVIVPYKTKMIKEQNFGPFQVTIIV
jgi:hypothetical protein